MDKATVQITAETKLAESRGTAPNWELFHYNIRQYSLYDMEDPAIDRLLHDMATLPIQIVDDTLPGTQLKLKLTFSDGGQALFKPIRFAREVEEEPQHDQYHTYERHIAEIAAFHLDRILGFQKVPPTTGRKINLTKEVLPLLPNKTGSTVFISEAGNTCFYGSCLIYCDREHAFCGDKDVMEGSVMTFLPKVSLAHPARPFYHFESCDSVRKVYPFESSEFMLEVIDVHTLDFLTGNRDRHNYDMIKEFKNETFLIMTDNGKGFGRMAYDDMLTLAPLRQCCIIRKSTLLKYIKLYSGPERVSTIMEKSLESDHVAPVLIRGHLTALDRRIVKILKVVADCLKYVKEKNVIISDYV